MKTEFEIKNEIQKINSLLKNEILEKQSRIALRVIRLTLYWALGDSELTPYEMAEMYLKENS